MFCSQVVPQVHAVDAAMTMESTKNPK